ncbi:uncharacterized protein B0T23DRAFT_314136 [Neurospora hispaniola]|uniref:Uncharacterized protein n=1 Tax=Neurospora hispaniola TaxID=588809 RepID=A0AAJ0I914_9PEZI|nr:hypothetical protein B0T23DRAFT_314136 [Neurospora hispaniola]
MSDQRPLPKTPRPGNGDNARITDYFKSIERTDNGTKSKRKLEDEENDQSTKRFKRSDDGQADSIKTARYQIKADTPKRKRKTPPSARLLDDTDGGLHDSLVDRWDFLKETGAEENAASEPKRPRPSVSVPAPASVNNHKRKRLASSRLLDDVDGGLSDSLVGRFETPKYEEKVSSGEEEKKKNASTHYTVDDDSEAETIKADNSKDDLSSEQDGKDYDSEEHGGDDEDSESNDSDKENVPPRVRYRTPSLPPLPATPEHHGSQNETGDATPSGQSSTSSSSLLLPSPVVDLPPLPSSSSSSSSTLVPEPSTLPSPPSSP